MNLTDRIISHLKGHQSGDYGKFKIVFPNKRAGLFFQRAMAEHIDRHTWMPEVASITEFIEGHSSLRVADKFTLILELYRAFGKHYRQQEHFSNFYFWGETLLADFDEIDNFLVDAKTLFDNLSKLKLIDQDLGFLSEEQKKIIRRYWKNFGQKDSRHKDEALSVWRILWPVYQQFKAVLQSRGLAYQGMIYREVAEKINETPASNATVIFAGFNALSASEENIMTWYCRERGGVIIWEADDFYLQDERQEAGKFLREIREHNPVLGKSLQGKFGNNFTNDTPFHIYEISGEAAQAQLAGEIIEKENYNKENAAVVLPDEQLMFPLLSALPTNVQGLNVTMGYPLKASQAQSFFEILFQLQIYRRKEKERCFNHRYVKTTLLHPYVASTRSEWTEKVLMEIDKDNKVYLRQDDLSHDDPLLSIIFSPASTPAALIDYFLEITMVLSREQFDLIEKEILLKYYKIFNLLKSFVLNAGLEMDIRAFQKLFRQSIFRERIPFEGEPLLGLQVMGLLETRNLNFDNIILLSSSEGILPPSKNDVSFIPQSFRKAFELPTIDHHDGIYAYVFYRLLQHAKNVHIIYNVETGNNRSGELSRFVKQLEWETNWQPVYHTVSVSVAPAETPDISFEMNDHVKSRLLRFVVQHGKAAKRFTPSAINTYFDCSLRFYFRYVEDIYEADEAEEDVDARIFGNIFHKVLELMYQDFKAETAPEVTKTVLEKIRHNISHFIDKAFLEEFGMDREAQFEYEGRNILVREVLKNIVKRVIDHDMEFAPFSIEGLEVDDLMLDLPIQSTMGDMKIGLKGIIDRIDSKDDIIRILDYKTGKDDKSFYDIPTLFEKEGSRRNKAAFQTFFYGLLYTAQPGKGDRPIMAGLYNIRELFQDDFDYRLRYKNSRDYYVGDIRPFLDEYKNLLVNFFEKLYDSDTVFRQTDDLQKCKFCPYAGLCKRDTGF